MVQIKKFGVLQTAKFMAVMYFITIALFMIPFGLIALVVAIAGMSMGSGSAEGIIVSGFMLLMPFVYGAMGFVSVAIACLIYNIVAKYIGGIEIEIEGSEPSQRNDSLNSGMQEFS